MMSSGGRRGVSRRRALLGGTAAIATAFGAGALWGSSAIAEHTATGARFALAASDVEYLRDVRFRHATVPWSFGFDDTHGCMYVLQAVGDVSTGDMCLIKLDHSGAERGHMYLRGFGRSLSVGVEPVGSDTYVWTEADSDPNSGHGRAITRFRFVDGTTIESGSSTIPTWRPVPGSTDNQPTVDMLNRRLVIRYRVNGSPRYRVYSLDDATTGRFETPLYSFAQAGIKNGETFQGFCSLGDYVYQIAGNAYSDANPPIERGDCHLSSIDVRTGALVERRWTQAAHSLDFRQPRGLAVQLTARPRLFMGFASGKVGAHTATFLYKPS